jgi:hypothetical protein
MRKASLSIKHSYNKQLGQLGLIGWFGGLVFGGLVSLRDCFLKSMVFAASKTHQKLQKSLLFQLRQKLFLKNFQPFKKNKKRNAQPTRQRRRNVVLTMVYKRGRHERQHLTAVTVTQLFKNTDY